MSRDPQQLRSCSSTSGLDAGACIETFDNNQNIPRTIANPRTHPVTNKIQVFMDPTLLTLLTGASGGAVVAVVSGVFSLISASNKDKAESNRQLRELATKLTLEQWPSDKAEWDEERKKLLPSVPEALKPMLPRANITNTYSKVISALREK